MNNTPSPEAGALLPCPFCGGSNVETFGPYGWYRQWGISHSCQSFYSGSQEMFQGFHTEDSAIAAWNRRAPLSAPEVGGLCEYLINPPDGGNQHFGSPYCRAKMREAAHALAAMQAERDAGREWVRRAWHELNAIRARDGAPEGVSEDWWSELTDALAEMLGDDTVPWMTHAALMLVQPYKDERDELRQTVADLYTERDAALAERDALRDDLNALHSAKQTQKTRRKEHYRKRLEAEARAAEKAQECEGLRRILERLHVLVWGECPSLLDEDSGGDARLDSDIHTALNPETPSHNPGSPSDGEAGRDKGGWPLRDELLNDIDTTTTNPADPAPSSGGDAGGR